MFRKAFAGVLALVGLLSANAVASQRIAPHVTPQEADIHTHIQLENPSAEKLSFTLMPYDIAGHLLPTVAGEVAPFSRLNVPAGELIGSASHFTMDADARLALTLRYTSGNAKHGLDFPAIKRAAAAWSLQGGLATAVAVVNMGENTTSVWLHQRDEAGKILASSRISDALAPGAKVLHEVDTALFQCSSGDTFEVIADQRLGLLALGSDETGGLKVHQAAVKRTAESERDDVGIWFITDGSLSDVFEMMGYNVATDRLWQGEMLRRAALGRLSEVFGESFVNQDSQARVTGYSQAELEAAYTNLSEEEQTVISSYVAGFNRRIAELRADPSQMPFEFLALGFSDIEDWSEIQVLAWASALQHNFTLGYGALHQLTFLSELQHLIGTYGNFAGAAMFLDIHWTNDPHALTMVPGDGANKTVEQPVMPILKDGVPDVRDLARRLDEQAENNRRLLKKIGAFVKGGSYAWVVSGDKTASGNPILYSGPQLEDPEFFQAPGIVQEGSIRGGGIEVAGLNVTGVPAIIVGRTPHHAWSFQVGHATSQDLYFDSADNIIAQRIETILVADGEPVSLPVVETHRGQVINAQPMITHKAAQRHYEFGFVKATLGLARANDMDSFGDAVADLAVSMHICYADVDKNIAYWHSGRQPVRPNGSWLVPQGTTSAPLDWDAAVIEPLVHDRNHPQGFYGGWNNRASQALDDPHGNVRYSRLHAAHTITDWLAANDDLTFDDVAMLARRIATTNTGFLFGGNVWQFFGEYFRAAVEANPSEERLAALAVIDDWNGMAYTGTEEDWPFSLDFQDGYRLTDTWLRYVTALTFADELTPFGDNVFGSRTRALLHLFDSNDRGLHKSYNWFRNATPGFPSDRDSIILAALDQAIVDLGERPWGIGQRPITKFRHALLGDLTEIIPDIATPYANRATYAQCVEYGPEGPVQIGTHFVLGQSGNVSFVNGQPVPDLHAFDMVPFLATFRLRPFPLYD